MVKRKGFTLTELLAVIAIIAIMSIAAISGYSAMSNNSKKKSLSQKVSQIELAAEKYATDNNLRNSSTISINKLIVMGYLQPDTVSSDGLALLNNPVNNENLVCNMVTIRIENDGYRAVFVENQKDCNIARDEVIDGNVDVTVVKYHDTSANRVVNNIGTSKEFDWTSDDVLINVSSDEYEPLAHSITYEYGGNVITKEIVADNKARTPSSYSATPVDHFNEIVIENVGLIFESPVDIIYNMKDGTTKVVEIIIRIDQEKPVGYTVVSNDTSIDSKRIADLFFDDGSGSGMKGFYYSTSDEVGSTTPFVLNERGRNTGTSGDMEAIYDLNHRNRGTLKLPKGKYYAFPFDVVGNVGEPILITVDNFDTNDFSCSIAIFDENGVEDKRDSSWFNLNTVVLRASSNNKVGDYGAKYNFLKGKNSLTSADLKLNVEPNTYMIAEIRESNEMAETDYAAGLKGTSSRNNTLRYCTKKIGIDRTKPTISIIASHTDDWKKTHNVTVRISDNLSWFTLNMNNKLDFKYGWSSSATTAPTTWIDSEAEEKTVGGKKVYEKTLTEGSGMSGEYYFWVLGSSVTDKALNSADNAVKTEVFKFDNTNPTCSSTGDNSVWTNNSVTITNRCVDDHSGCKDEIANTVQFTTTTQTSNINAYNIEDNAGNKTSCPARTADIYVDVTAPVCSLSMEAIASSANVKVKLTKSDAHSDVKDFGIDGYNSKTEVTHSLSSEQTYTGYVRDNALNELPANSCKIKINRLNYNVNGGNACTYSYKYGENGKKWGTLCSPTRTGYTFSKWTNSSGTEVTNNTTVSRDENLTAQWTANTYTVSYEPNGGSACNPATKSVTYGLAYGDLCTTSKTGHRFTGWKKDDGTTVTSSSVVNTASNHTLTASWTARNYTVSYLGCHSGCDNTTVTYGSTYGTLCTPSVTGYNFLRWTDSSGATVTSDTIVSTASDHGLIGVCEARGFTLTYDDGYGEGCSSKAGTYGNAWGDLCTPTLDHYDFNGWKDGSGNDVTDKTICYGDLTVYAQYSVHNHTLTYDNNGGSGCTSKTAQYGGKWGNLCTPTKDNAEFKGWKDAFGNTITAQSDVTGDLTVYAEWEDTAIVLTARANDSNATVSKTSFTLDPGGDATFTVRMNRTSLYGIGHLSDVSVTCNKSGHGAITITGQSVPSAGSGYISAGTMPKLDSGDMWTEATIKVSNVRESMTCTFNLVKCTYYHVHSGKYYIYKGFKVNGNHKDTAASKVYKVGTCVCAVRGWWMEKKETKNGYLIVNQSNQLYYKWLAFETHEDHNDDYWDNACTSSTALW